LYTDGAAIDRDWEDFAGAVDLLAARISDPREFPVLQGSSLYGDDRKAKPFLVSEAIRHIINTTVDQLHGVKVAVHDAQYRHLAVSATLARSALENSATGLWILGPRLRAIRIERVLRWHARNYQDFQTYLGGREGQEAAGARNRTNVASDQLRSVAVSCSADPKIVASGFQVTVPIKGAQQYTDLPVLSDWRIASGFAHARPWAHQGFLNRVEHDLSVSGNRVYEWTAREDITVYLPRQAMRLLTELLVLRDRRAGLVMPPRPDRSPDGERVSP